MKSDLKLSIIIPTYNCSAYIAQCLDSVLSQLPSGCEVIASHIIPFEGERIVGIPAYGPNTGPHNWYQNEAGRKIIQDEFKKLDLLICSLDLGILSKRQ